jgi:hypothetical protein
MMKTAAWAGPSAAPVPDVQTLPALLEVELVYIDHGGSYRTSLAEAMMMLAYNARIGVRTTVRLPDGRAIAAYDGSDLGAEPPMAAALFRMVELLDQILQALNPSTAAVDASQDSPSQAPPDTAAAAPV